jgi:hypothetical protein
MARLVRQSMEEGMDWGDLKRNWALGGEAFIKEMVVEAGAWMGRGGRRESYAGEPAHLHDEVRARKLVKSGLAGLGLKAQDLPKMKKTDSRKRALAHWIKSQSTMGNAWLAQELHMGHAANVAARLDEEGKKCQKN